MTNIPEPQPDSMLVPSMLDDILNTAESPFQELNGYLQAWFLKSADYQTLGGHHERSNLLINSSSPRRCLFEVCLVSLCNRQRGWRSLTLRC